MDNYACYADTVKEEFVKKMCPKEYKAFMRCLDDSDTLDLGEFAREYLYTSDDKDMNRVCKLFGKLCIAFEKATQPSAGLNGLSLSLVYKEAEDRGDELNGVGWEVGGVYMYSPAGSKFQNEITRLSWTEFS
jgi:hypothetical protein